MMSMSYRSLRPWTVAAPAVLAATVLAAPPARAQAPDNTLTDAEKQAGWVLLFDGKTMDQWRGYRIDGLPPLWSVVDGTITATAGKGGADLVSKTEYTDFELAIDFKVAPGGNSGIFYHGVESPTAPIYRSAPEYQILDDERHPDAKNGPDRYCGTNYDVDPPLVRACNPAGQWNSARILVKGAHVEHWLNGKKTADYELWSPEWKAKVAASKFATWPEYGMARTGRLALQHHGDDVAFRNIKIRVLQ
jgi:hypothetical protein